MAKLALFGNPNSKTTRDLLSVDIAKNRTERSNGEPSTVFSETLTQAQAVSAAGDSSINVSGGSFRSLRRL